MFVVIISYVAVVRFNVTADSHRSLLCACYCGDAEFAGVENAGVEISGEEKVGKAKQ